MKTPRGYQAFGPTRLGLTVLVLAAGLAIAVQPGGAAVKTRADFDVAFDFQQPRTWGWNPEGAGDVFMARTPDDDPAAVKRLAEPLIMSAATAEMPRRGLKPAAGTPDLTLTYYLLLSYGSSAQTLGQFLPSTTAWALPPFLATTTSLEVIPQGSLVLDLSTSRGVVWRGIGEAQVKWELDQAKRNALLREAVQEILKLYPPKPPKK